MLRLAALRKQYWLKRLFNAKRATALITLKSRLKKEGFDIEYQPDTSSVEYKVGAEVWIPLVGPDSIFDLARKINEEVAKQFGLIAVGRAPVMLENALYFAVCCFRREPLG